MTRTGTSGQDRRSEGEQHPLRPLLLGAGWFPNEVGGLERYFRELIERLADIDRNPIGIVIGPATSPPPGVIAVSDRGDPLWRRLWAYWRAAQRVSDDVDVIHAHFALYAFPIMVVGRLRRKPLVVQFQGPWADESRVGGDRSMARAWLRARLERFVYRRAAVILTLSGAFKRILVERYGIEPWKIRVSPPGVDVSRFAPGDKLSARAALGLPQHGFIAMVARRMVPRTGVITLLDAWNRIPYMDGSTLLVLGDGPQRAELLQRVESAGMRGVRFLGPVSDDTLIQCYRAADVNVVPTVSNEGYGLVVLEAAASGCPSLVTDVDALPEAVFGIGENLIVPSNNPQCLADALLDCSRPDARLPTEARCRRHAEAHSWEATIKRTLTSLSDAATGSCPKPRAVYLDHVARISGGEIALLRLLTHLDGVNCHVILAEEGPLVGRLLRSGCSVEVLPLRSHTRDVRRGDLRWGLPGIWPVLNTLWHAVRLGRRLRALRPDLVHANSLKSGFYGGMAARTACVPMLWHLRDRITTDYLPRPAIPLVRAALRSLPVAVVANSQATLQAVAPFPDRLSVAVISDPVDVPEESAQQREGSFTVGMVGRFAPWKGQNLFVEAFRRAFPDGSERAVIVGAALFGEDDFYLEVRRQVAASSLEDRIEFRGHRDDVDEQLRQFDVLVHASLVPEPFGQVILEGMAMGLPVVAAGAGGPAEVIDHNVTGLLYMPGDADALARALRRLRDDDELRHDLGERARKRARDFGGEAIASQMRILYEDMTVRTERRGPGR